MKKYINNSDEVDMKKRAAPLNQGKKTALFSYIYETEGNGRI